MNMKIILFFSIILLIFSAGAVSSADIDYVDVTDSYKPVDGSLDVVDTVSYDSSELSDKSEINPDVTCEANDLEGLDLYVQVMNTKGTASEDSVREKVAQKYHTIIPKEHSDTLRLKNDISTIGKQANH